jgi:hypothetical protein
LDHVVLTGAFRRPDDPWRHRQFGLGLILLTIGGQMVSATENALINTLETPLAVAWVWVCFSEVPTITSFIGGPSWWQQSPDMFGTAVDLVRSLRLRSAIALAIPSLSFTLPEMEDDRT